MTTAYITHPDCLRHEMIEYHPECPERLGAVEDQLNAAGLFDYMRYLDAPNASVAQIERAHCPDYVHEIFNKSPLEGLAHVDPDTWMNPWTLEAAQRAAGAGIMAVDKVLAGEIKNAFCNVRPPGHHAEYKKAMGFCFFNNVAIAALHALEQPGIERVAVVDFDVHHGNGTEDILHHNPHALYCSTFQHPFFPDYYHESSEGLLANAPLSAGAGSPEFRHAVQTVWLPALEEFKPDFLFISAGFDAHREDDMSGVNLTEADYIWVTRKLMDIADRHSAGRLVSMLEGGYDLSSLGRSAAAHVRVLMNL
jgi:acetoin utilization deacetylase AcuC-like enzyme